VVDGWEPANELERRLLDAMQRQDQETYFAELARAELLLPVPVDAAGRPVDGWATWAHEGRTYLLAFTSPAALGQILGQYAGDSVPSRLADIASRWPDPTWWLAVDFGLPIAGYLPESFVTQLAASTPPAPASRPTDTRQGAGAATAEPAEAEADLWQPASNTEPEAWAPPAAGRPAPAPDTAGEPTRWDAGTATEQPTGTAEATAPGQAVEAAGTEEWPAGGWDSRSTGPWSEPSGDAPPSTWRPASTLSAGAVPAEEVLAAPPADDVTEVVRPVDEVAAADVLAEEATAPSDQDFQPANDTEQALLTAARVGDNRSFLDALLTSYALLPVPPDAPTDAPVSAPAFPWPAIQRGGGVQVPVFTSPERMTERVGETQFVVAPFIQVVEHWPNHDWALALNPDTAIGATLSGDRIRELADWSREQQLAERLGIHQPPPNTPAPFDQPTPDQPPIPEPTPTFDQPPYTPTPPEQPEQPDQSEEEAAAQPWGETAQPSEEAAQPPEEAAQPSEEAAHPPDATEQPEQGAERIEEEAPAPEGEAEQPTQEPEPPEETDQQSEPPEETDQAEEEADQVEASEEEAEPEQGSEAPEEAERPAEDHETGAPVAAAETPAAEAVPVADEAGTPEEPPVAEQAEQAGETEDTSASGEVAGPVDMPVGAEEGVPGEWPPVPVVAVGGGEQEERAVPEPAPLTFPVVLQKLLPAGHEAFYLERHFDQVSGYLHRVEDTARYAGPATLRSAVGEASPGGPCHLLRWPVERSELVPVLGASFAVGDPALTEYRVATMRLPHGAELYRIGEDGSQVVLAVYDADHHRWHRLV
jgi:hypothetical protein